MQKAFQLYLQLIESQLLFLTVKMYSQAPHSNAYIWNKVVERGKYMKKFYRFCDENM